jgi:hypothetical protein
MMAFDGLFEKQACYSLALDEGHEPGDIAVERSPVGGIGEAGKPQNKDIKYKILF